MCMWDEIDESQGQTLVDTEGNELVVPFMGAPPPVKKPTAAARRPRTRPDLSMVGTPAPSTNTDSNLMLMALQNPQDLSKMTSTSGKTPPSQQSPSSGALQNGSSSKGGGGDDGSHASSSDPPKPEDEPYDEIQLTPAIDAMKGSLCVWEPIIWKLKRLPHRKLSTTFSSTLVKFMADSSNHMMSGSHCFKLDGDLFFDIFHTDVSSGDRYHFSKMLTEIHEKNQRRKVITPVIIKARTRSNLPFPVVVKSRALVRDDGHHLAYDLCNQKHALHMTPEGAIMRHNILTTSSCTDTETDFKIVTDFRNMFSSDSKRTMFLIDPFIINSEYRSLGFNNGTVVIKKLSNLMSFIYAFSLAKGPMLAPIKEQANILMSEISKAKISCDINGTDPYYTNIPESVAKPVIDFMLTISKNVPRFPLLNYEISPAPGISWCDHRTWPFHDVEKSGVGEMLSTSEAGGIDAMKREKVFTVTVDFEIYYF